MTDELGEALLTLAEESGRQVQSGRGFASVHLDLGMTLADQYQRFGALTDAQRHAARHLLRNYDVAPAAPTPSAPPTVSKVASLFGGPKPATAPKPPTPAPTSPRAPVQRRDPSVAFKVIDGKIRVTTPFALKDVCKEIPGRRWNGNLKVWEWDAGPIAADTIAAAFADHDPVWDEAFEALTGTMGRAAEVKAALDLEDIPGLKTVAWLHQRQAYWFIEHLTAAQLDMGVGTGKSLVAVGVAMSVGGDILILCPSKVVGVWPREFRRHADRPVHIENCQRPKKRGHGMTNLKVAERVEAFKALRDCDCGMPHVYVTNYEAIAHEPLKTWISSQDWDLLVNDESHRLKAPQGVQSKLAAKIGKRSAKRLGLTGSLMPHTPLDIFAQYRILDPAVFGTAFSAFTAKWANFGGYENHEYLGMKPEMLDEFHERVYSVGFCVESDDVLDLPEVLPDQTIEVTLEGPQAKAYADMEKNLAAEFPGKTPSEIIDAVITGEITSPNAMVNALRLRQITGGALKDDNTGQTLILGDAKRKALAEWMEPYPDGKGRDERGEPIPAEPLVVYTAFTHDLAMVRAVAEEQGRRYGEVSGRANDLNADSEYPPDVDVLGVNVQSGGAGVDLTRACHACYYSWDWSLGNDIQTRGRLHRPGQTRPVRFTRLVAAGTIDEAMLASIEEHRVDVDAARKR